jgi:surface polysaccharide O-acyltransferase-like enzyme
MDYHTRLGWPDILRIVAVFAVMLIHSAAPLLVAYQELPPAAWWAGNIYDSLARWCIPVFVMLSGTFLIDRAYQLGPARFLRRRAARMLVPLLLWSVVYLLWRSYANGEQIPLSSFPALILTGPVYYHLWFIYLLVGLYLLAPILAMYVKAASRRSLAYFLLLWVAAGSLLPVAERFWGFELYPTGGATDSAFRYVGYFVLGHLLRDVPVRAGQRWLLGGAFLLGLAATAGGTYYLTVVRNGGVFDGLLYEYYSINVGLMAVAAYLGCKGIRTPKLLRGSRLPKRLVHFVALCVPGMYLVHAMVISALGRGMAGVVLDGRSFDPVIGVPLFALVVFVISFAVTAVIRAVPLVRRSVP